MGVSAASCVVAGDLWRIVGCGEEGMVLEHATGDVVGKLLYLFPNLMSKNIAFDTLFDTVSQKQRNK